MKIKRALLIGILFLGINFSHAEVDEREFYIASMAYMNDDYDKALVNGKKYLDKMVDVYGKGHDKVAISYNLIANVLEAKKDYTKAITNYSKALDVANKVAASAESSYIGLGSSYFELQKYENAVKSYKQALSYRENPKSINHDKLWFLLQNIGTTYHKLKDYKNSKLYYAKALDKAKNLGAKTSIMDLTGQMAEESKDYQLAIKSYTDIVEIGKQLDAKNPNPQLKAMIKEYNGKVLILKNKMGENQ